MTTTLQNLILGAVLLVSTLPLPLNAAVTYDIFDIVPSPTIRFDNTNWFTLPHPRVASFTINEDGSSYGTTENGIPFVQYNVPNDANIRIQRFEIEDHYHYVVEGEIVYTITELSARLAEATTNTNLI